MNNGEGAEPQDTPSYWASLKPERAKSNPVLVFGVALFVAAAFYAGLVVISRADTVLFPSGQIRINLPISLPLVDGGDGLGRYGDRFNILVLGLDRNMNEPRDMPTRSDTIFVLTVDMLNHEAAILSFPRDLVVDIPDSRGGYVKDRINTAFPVGMVQGGRQEGVKRAIATMKRNFGIDIDRHVTIDFASFQNIIDTLGGIDMTIGQEVGDPKYILPSRGTPAYFRLGPAHMDGETALAYSRIRLDSDLKRIQRQHQVMRAVMDKVMSLQLLTKTFSLWREYQDTIDTDLPDWEVPGLALLALRVGSERVTTYSLEEAVQPAVGNGGASILLAKQDKVQAILKKVFYDPRLRREGATVQVLDSSGDPQRSARFSAYLASQGLSEGRVINGGLDLPLSGSETTIFNLTDKKYTARSLAQWLNLPDGRVKGRNAAVAEAIPTGVDILLVLGPDAKVP
ncbi:MAG TPA: LCP family protein [Dehalococcoidia bacterium]|nr:LCP family protein [Dehalococcoidia bacterium]HLB29432.1 LCP family protein [Dehalococcoidia bacterium]